MEEERIKFSSIVLCLAGIGILISLPWFETWGMNLWFTSKLLFFIGLIALMAKR